MEMLWKRIFVCILLVQWKLFLYMPNIYSRVVIKILVTHIFVKFVHTYGMRMCSAMHISVIRRDALSNSAVDQ